MSEKDASKVNEDKLDEVSGGSAPANFLEKSEIDQAVLPLLSSVKPGDEIRFTPIA